MGPRRKLRVLIVAGHDPSGAGVDADRAALDRMDVEGIAVVTAWTEQDDAGLKSIGARDPSAWLDEATRAISPSIEAIKFGLLPGVAHVRAAAELVRRAREKVQLHIVVDPVLSASSGGRFLDAAAVESLRGELLGLRVIVTPNLDEAAELARIPARDLRARCEARAEAARILLGLGAAAVVVKGGHGEDDPVRDLVLEETGRATWLEHPRTQGGNIRGSGCRYATRLAGRLAQGSSLVESARDAADHVASAIARAART